MESTEVSPKVSCPGCGTKTEIVDGELRCPECEWTRPIPQDVEAQLAGHPRLL